MALICPNLLSQTATDKWDLINLVHNFIGRKPFYFIKLSHSTLHVRSRQDKLWATLSKIAPENSKMILISSLSIIYFTSFWSLQSWDHFSPYFKFSLSENHVLIKKIQWSTSLLNYHLLWPQIISNNPTSNT